MHVTLCKGLRGFEKPYFHAQFQDNLPWQSSGTHKLIQVSSVENLMKYKGCVVLMPAKYETKWLLSEKKLMSELCSDPLQQHWGICAALNLMDFLVGISVLSSYNLHQHYCLGDEITAQIFVTLIHIGAW